MAERGPGVFAITREIFDHPDFPAEPFTQREAWMWLISEAAWRQRRVHVGGVSVTLQRGQLASSVRFMAERWKWHRSSVERFLKRRKTATAITIAVETGVSVITLCNYDRYQVVGLPSETPTETPGETAPRQHRDKQETLKHSNIEKQPDADASPVENFSHDQPQSAAKKTVRSDGLGSDEDRFWALAPALEAKGVTRSMIGKLANALDGDFSKGLDALQDSLKAKTPRPYLSKIIRTMEHAGTTAPRTDSGVPAWVIDARAYGYPVEQEGAYWRFAGGLYDDTKQLAGN